MGREAVLESRIESRPTHGSNTPNYLTLMNTMIMLAVAVHPRHPPRSASPSLTISYDASPVPWKRFRPRPKNQWPITD